MYIYTRKHNLLCHWSPWACVEGCVVYVLAFKCCFMHFQSLGECTVDCVGYTSKQQLMIHICVQNTVECMSMLGNANFWTNKACLHAQKSMSMLGNTILCTTEVNLHGWNAMKCMSLLRNASLCTSEALSMHSGVCKVSLDLFMVCHHPYACAEDCIINVHARKCKFVHDQGLWTCGEDYFMYDHARKHHWVYDQMHSGPCKVSVHLKQQLNTHTCAE